LNADDIYPLGLLQRAVFASNAHPDWLMVYAEAEEFNDETGLVQRYPALPPSAALDGFRSYYSFSALCCVPSIDGGALRTV